MSTVSKMHNDDGSFFAGCWILPIIVVSVLFIGISFFGWFA